MTANHVTDRPSRKLKEMKTLRKRFTESNLSLTKRNKKKSLLRSTIDPQAANNPLLRLRTISNLSAATINAVFHRMRYSVSKKRTIMKRILTPAADFKMLIFTSRYKHHEIHAMTLNRFKFKWSKDWRLQKASRSPMIAMKRYLEVVLWLPWDNLWCEPAVTFKMILRGVYRRLCSL